MMPAGKILGHPVVKFKSEITIWSSYIFQKGSFRVSAHVFQLCYHAPTI